MRSMRIRMVALVLAGAGCAGAAEFTRTLPPADYAAAGLHKLTPEERARLDALVARHRAGVEVPAAATPRGAPPGTPTADPARAAAAPDKVVVSRGPKGEVRRIESRLVGEFRGWSRRTGFRLEDGSRWVVANPEEYDADRLENPRVTLEPALFGTYWLKIEGVNRRVRVRPDEPR